MNVRGHADDISEGVYFKLIARLAGMSVAFVGMPAFIYILTLYAGIIDDLQKDQVKMRISIALLEQRIEYEAGKTASFLDELRRELANTRQDGNSNL